MEAFLHNGCSNVKGVPLVREVVKRKPRPAQPAPPESRKPPLARPKAASAPAAAATDKAAGVYSDSESSVYSVDVQDFFPEQSRARFHRVFAVSVHQILHDALLCYP